MEKLEEIYDLENTLTEVRALNEKEVKKLEEETNELKVSRFF